MSKTDVEYMDGVPVAKVCSNCLDMIALVYFERQKKGLHGRLSKCRQCDSDYRKLKRKEKEETMKNKKTRRIYYNYMQKPDGSVERCRYSAFTVKGAYRLMANKKKREAAKGNLVIGKLALEPLLVRPQQWGKGEFHFAPAVNAMCIAFLHKFKTHGNRKKHLKGFKRETDGVSEDELRTTLSHLADKYYDEYMKAEKDTQAYRENKIQYNIYKTKLERMTA